MRKKIVFFTGAGMSRESGLPTFRGEGGIWNEIDAEAVASARSWYCGRCKDCNEKRQAMLDFFNPLRRSILEHEPNEGHRIIAELEKEYDVTVITQNGDDYHTRAGSSNVIYLHGEALKNTSTANPYIPIPIDRTHPDIHIGDKAPDGSQIRPFVIYFDENIDRKLWQKAVKATKEADYFVVVGSTMSVFPAADLLKKIKPTCLLYVIDPGEVQLPSDVNREYSHISKPASEGLGRLMVIWNDFKLAYLGDRCLTD
jgi:transcriptional regulator, sir2 family